MRKYQKNTAATKSFKEVIDGLNLEVFVQISSATLWVV